ncbi:MAG: pyruvate kinase [Patescibacteria group bacterium]
MHSKAQIIATIGDASTKREVLRSMIEHQCDVIRMNFSWANNEVRAQQITLIRELEKETGRRVLIIQDLPGPRIQTGKDHTYDHAAASSLTDEDESSIRFGAEHHLDYIALSFVGGPADIEKCREVVRKCGGSQKIIAKIERAVALESLDKIIEVSDAVMVARGDLGNEVPLEQIPFVQDRIIQQTRKAGKPVIVATQMLLSMVKNSVPTRAEVTDVAYAILRGADAVMLSEESAIGAYPVEAVTMMEKIILEAERHMGTAEKLHLL